MEVYDTMRQGSKKEEGGKGSGSYDDFRTDMVGSSSAAGERTEEVRRAVDSLRRLYYLSDLRTFFQNGEYSFQNECNVMGTFYTERLTAWCHLRKTTFSPSQLTV
jgi:hypothetical protein